MTPFEVTTLGTGAALPARGRYPSAQLFNAAGHLYLIDCGEGTQERLRQAGVNINRIRRVMISHMHGDHYLGLMGLISTMHLLGRTAELHIHGPVELKPVIDIQLRASGTWLRYPLHVHQVEHLTGVELFADEQVRVTGLALRHRVPTTGFLFNEQQRPRKLLAEAVHRIPHYLREAVKAGADLELPDGSVVPNAELTMPPPAPRRYAYCADTAPCPELVPWISGVDLLYHEATFTADMAARARETLHSTAAQAAAIARDAAVGDLLLGHFSSRYSDVNVLLLEAREVFPRVRLSQEGRTFRIEERSFA